MKRKNDALTCIKEMESPYRAKGVKLKHYHTDGAGDLIGQDVREYLRSIDALYDSSEPYTPEHNAHAERVFRTIGEMANCMLHDSGLPVTFWGYSILTATYIKNRFPCHNDFGYETPIKSWTGEVPDWRNFRVFGCKAYDFIPRNLRTKEFEIKCKIGYFVGYFPNGAWKVYVPALNKELPPAGSVTFDEHIPPRIQEYWQDLFPRTTSESSGKPADFEYLVGTRHKDDEDGLEYEVTSIATVRGEIVGYRKRVNPNGLFAMPDRIPVHIRDIELLTQGVPLAHSSQDTGSLGGEEETKTSGDRTTETDDGRPPRRKRTKRQLTNVSTLGDVGAHTAQTENSDPEEIIEVIVAIAAAEGEVTTPRNYKEAMKSPEASKWREAVRSELDSLRKFGTYIPVHDPRHRAPPFEVDLCSRLSITHLALSKNIRHASLLWGTLSVRGRIILRSFLPLPRCPRSEWSWQSPQTNAYMSTKWT